MNDHPRPAPRDTANLFAAWLDADGLGTAHPEPRSDADLSAACEAARQIHDLDAGLQRYASAVSPHHTRTWEDIMTARSELLSAAPASPVPLPHRSPSKAHRRNAVQWPAFANAIVAMTLLLGLSIGIWRQAGSPSPADWLNRPGNEPRIMLPAASPSTATTSSSFPYPTSSECTIAPLTREEVRAHYEAANVAPAPSDVRYERAIEPSTEDAKAIMETFRMWQACRLGGRAMAYSLSMETPWFTTHSMGWFFDWTTQPPQDRRPVSERTLAFLTDLALVDEADQATVRATYPDVYPSAPGDASATPVASEPAPTYVPVPSGATPASGRDSEGRGLPSIFARDIRIVGPDRAQAAAYFVNEYTGEVATMSPQYIEFVKVDGRWLIDSISGGEELG